MKNLVIFLFGLALLFAGTACKKNQSYDLKPNLNVANDNILSHRPFINVFNMIVKASRDSALQQQHHSLIDSASVTLSPDNKKLTFIYSGTLCPDSVRRKGGFEVVLDTSFFVEGTKAFVTFKNYFEDSHYIIASDSMIFSNSTSDSKMVYTNYISDALITKDSLRVIHWNGLITFTLPPEILQNGNNPVQIEVNGSATGISSMGYGFRSTITSSLLEYLDCPWILDGKMELFIPDAVIRGGTIGFISKTTCNNLIDYDFEGTVYHWRISEPYLGPW